MEVDRSIIILVVILFIVIGIFAFIKSGDASTVSNNVGYAAQYAGGGCGR